MESEDNRVQTTIITTPTGHTQHYYTRYMGEHTELWCFGSGLGDQTCIRQVGECFLHLMDIGEDPHLGRIMMSFGSSETSALNYLGDHTVYWAWGLNSGDLKKRITEFLIKPKYILSPYKVILDEAENLGCVALQFFSGVSPRVFKPLKGKTIRTGYGFAGLPKSKEQEEIMLSPAMEKGQLEWITKDPREGYLTNEELNKWYSTKRAVFGMMDEYRQGMDFIPTRFFETVASGTPFITYRINGLEKHVGIKYPFMSSSKEETLFLMEVMESDYPKTLKYFRDLSTMIREKHSYDERLRELFEVLKDG